MKKYILVFAFIWLTLVTPAYAQVNETKQDAYQQALIQLITLLQEQVKLLLIELQQVKQSQITIQTTLNERPVERATGSAPAYIAPVEIDKSSITVKQFPGNVHSDFPFGHYIFMATVLDKDGKPNASKANDGMFVPVIMTVSTSTGVELVDERFTNPVGQFQFGYAPKTPGVKTLTFTSGGLSTYLTLDVK
jgi:hypothetical protein